MRALGFPQHAPEIAEEGKEEEHPDELDTRSGIAIEEAWASEDYEHVDNAACGSNPSNRAIDHVFLLSWHPSHEQQSRYEPAAAVSSAGTGIGITFEDERDGPAIRRAADAVHLRQRYVPRMA